MSIKLVKLLVAVLKSGFETQAVETLSSFNLLWWGSSLRSPGGSRDGAPEEEYVFLRGVYHVVDPAWTLLHTQVPPLGLR